VVARLQRDRQWLIVVWQDLFDAYKRLNDAHEATTEWAGDDRKQFRADIEKIGLYLQGARTYLANQISAYDGLIWDYEHGQ